MSTIALHLSGQEILREGKEGLRKEAGGGSKRKHTPQGMSF